MIGAPWIPNDLSFHESRALVDGAVRAVTASGLPQDKPHGAVLGVLKISPCKASRALVSRSAAEGYSRFAWLGSFLESQSYAIQVTPATAIYARYGATMTTRGYRSVLSLPALALPCQLKTRTNRNERASSTRARHTPSWQQQDRETSSSCTVTNPLVGQGSHAATVAAEGKGKACSRENNPKGQSQRKQWGRGAWVSQLGHRGWTESTPSEGPPPACVARATPKLLPMSIPPVTGVANCNDARGVTFPSPRVGLLSPCAAHGTTRLPFHRPGLASCT